MAERSGRPATDGRRPTAVRRVLLASEQAPFRDDVLEAAAGVAGRHGATVSVFQLLRLWGSGLGLPHPGLRPNREELDAAADSVRAAVQRLERAGVEVSGSASRATRNPAKAITRRAVELGVDLIVIGAPSRGRIGALVWANEPYRVARRAPMDVYLVKQPAG